LDLIFTDSVNRIDSVKTGPPLDPKLTKSHLVLSWDYNLKKISGGSLEYKKSKYMYKKGDYNKLREILDKQDWEKFLKAGIYNTVTESF